MINWPDITFPPINLWSMPVILNNKEVAQVTEDLILKLRLDYIESVAIVLKLHNEHLNNKIIELCRTGK